MFRKAERKKSKLRLAITGPSGSGKTLGALKIAKGIGGRIAMIDTENGSGELYSDYTDYDVLQLNPPYSPERYIQAIRDAEKAGYETLIIDSLSHAWAGEGGVLDIVDKSQSKNSFTAWKDATPKQNKLIDSILHSPIHIIATMRSKTAYSMVEKNGKQVPQKVGLAPIQREGVDFEFTVVFDVSIDRHIASVSKDRTRLFDGEYFVIDETVGNKLIDWLNTGIAVVPTHEGLTMDEWVEKIITAETMESLQGLYSSIYKSQLYKQSDFQKRINKAKEDRKKYLTEVADKVATEFFGEEKKSGDTSSATNAS